MKMMNKRKIILLLMAVTLLLAATVGGTIAYLHTSTGTVKNTFEPSSVVPVIAETFTNNVKTDVWLWNSGSVDAYLRATVVVNWKNGYNVIPAKAGVDYTIAFNTGGGSKWTEADGIYYYADKISPSAEAPAQAGYTDGTKVYSTAVLVSECKPVGNPPADGYKLNVEILAQAIQAEGMDASGAQDAFGKSAQ